MPPEDSFIWMCQSLFPVLPFIIWSNPHFSNSCVWKFQSKIMNSFLIYFTFCEYSLYLLDLKYKRTIFSVEVFLEFKFHFPWEVKNCPTFICVASFHCCGISTHKSGFQIKFFVVFQCSRLNKNLNWFIFSLNLYSQTA